MSAVFADRVKETSTTTGTGTLTLAGAATGFQSFNSAFGTGIQIEYFIEAVDANGVPTGDWEVGDGYLASSSTLVRDQVRASTNSNALVNFGAGTKNVICGFPGHRARMPARTQNLKFGVW